MFAGKKRKASLDADRKLAALHKRYSKLVFFPWDLLPVEVLCMIMQRLDVLSASRFRQSSPVIWRRLPLGDGTTAAPWLPTTATISIGADVRPPSLPATGTVVADAFVDCMHAACAILLENRYFARADSLRIVWCRPSASKCPESGDYHCSDRLSAPMLESLKRRPNKMVDVRFTAATNSPHKSGGARVGYISATVPLGGAYVDSCLLSSWQPGCVKNLDAIVGFMNFSAVEAAASASAEDPAITTTTVRALAIAGQGAVAGEATGPYRQCTWLARAFKEHVAAAGRPCPFRARSFFFGVHTWHPDDGEKPRKDAMLQLIEDLSDVLASRILVARGADRAKPELRLFQQQTDRTHAKPVIKADAPLSFLRFGARLLQRTVEKFDQACDLKFVFEGIDVGTLTGCSGLYDALTARTGFTELVFLNCAMRTATATAVWPAHANGMFLLVRSGILRPEARLYVRAKWDPCSAEVPESQTPLLVPLTGCRLLALENMSPNLLEFRWPRSKHRF
eukprot:tig00020996_g16955.t1